MKSRVMFVWRGIRHTSLSSVPAWQKSSFLPSPPKIHTCGALLSYCTLQIMAAFQEKQLAKIARRDDSISARQEITSSSSRWWSNLCSSDSYPPSVTTQIWKLPSYAIWKPRNYRLKCRCFTNHLSICSGCLLVSKTNGAWRDASLHSKYPCNSSLSDGVFVNNDMLKQKRCTSEMCFWSAWITECDGIQLCGIGLNNAFVTRTEFFFFIIVIYTSYLKGVWVET